MAEKSIQKKVSIPEFKKEAIIVTIEGDSDLMLCRMTDQAATDIKESQTKTGKGATKAKEAINMWQRLIESVHWINPQTEEYTEEGWKNAMANNKIGYDASGIKKGLCDAAVRVLGESKSTVINANMQVIPETKNLIPVEFGSVAVDESIITNWKGSAFLTYRNVFSNWKMSFRIEYLPANISMDQVITLVQAMGFANGLGAHRVGLKGGTNGQFHVTNVVQVA